MMLNDVSFSSFSNVSFLLKANRFSINSITSCIRITNNVKFTKYWFVECFFFDQNVDLNNDLNDFVIIQVFSIVDSSVSSLFYSEEFNKLFTVFDSIEYVENFQNDEKNNNNIHIENDHVEINFRNNDRNVATQSIRYYEDNDNHDQIVKNIHNIDELSTAFDSVEYVKNFQNDEKNNSNNYIENDHSEIIFRDSDRSIAIQSIRYYEDNENHDRTVKDFLSMKSNSRKDFHNNDDVDMNIVSVDSSQFENSKISETETKKETKKETNAKTKIETKMKNFHEKNVNLFSTNEVSQNENENDDDDEKIFDYDDDNLFIVDFFSDWNTD